jgi:hypothetical protein
MAWRTGLFRWSSSDRLESPAPVNPSDSRLNGTHPPSAATGDEVHVIPAPYERAPAEVAQLQDGANTDAEPNEVLVAELVPAPSVALEIAEAPADSSNVVHDLFNGLEESFASDATQLENEAMAEARAWAEKGLPRHDLKGKLEVEEVLSRRAAHVLAGWVHRARSRIEGAIQTQSELIGKHVIALDQHLLRYRYLLDELRASRSSLLRVAAQDEREASEAARAPKRKVAYTSRLGGGPFWIFCAILVLADFVANVPVFNELLPSSPVATQALQNMEINAAADPGSYGWKTFLAKLGMHLDASILAFSVILFLVILGHFFGSSIRTIVALHRAESYVHDELLLRHRRQPKFVAWASFAGILTIVAVLFLARGGIEAAASGRLARVENSLVQVRQQLSAAQANNDPTRVQQLDIERQKLEASMPVLQSRHEYAVSIAALNLPILALNIVLALCAALLAYLHQSESFDLEAAARTPQTQTPSARDRYVACRAAVEKERGNICALASQVYTCIWRVRHLTEASPTLDAGAKTERLRAIVPLFRAENARVRGLDTRSIHAFQTATPALPEVELPGPFHVPDLFTESLERYDHLLAEFRRLERDREVTTEMAE